MAIYLNIFNILMCLGFIHCSLGLYLNDRPKILADYSETILEVGDNYTIICMGNKKLQWTTPQVLVEEYADWTRIHMTDFVPPDMNYRYASRLVLENMSFPFVGYYKCHNENSEDEDKSSQIYLYVRDPNHLSVNEEAILTVSAVQGDIAIMDCRPTSPDVSVELTLFNGEKINATFDPKTGFRYIANDLSDEEFYICKFYNDTELVNELHIKLNVVPLIDSLPKPSLEEVTGGHTEVGGNLTLVCKVKTHAGVSLEWSTPRGAPDLQHVYISQLYKPYDSGMYVQYLIINKTTLADKGTYYCNASVQNHLSSSRLDVRIYALNEHFIQLEEENGIYALSVTAGTTEPVLWIINVKAHPPPKLHWLNNNNDTIMSSPKYMTRFTSTEAMLEIKDISINDFGSYTLVAENDYQTELLPLFLNVTDKPSVHIESDQFLLINEPNIIKCIAAAYPKPNIYWSVKTCSQQSTSCSFKRIHESYSDQRGLQLISYVNVTDNKPVTIKCIANNSMGSDEATKIIYVSDVRNGLGIFGMDKSVDLERDHAIVAKGEYFSMTCGASVYNYTDKLQWYYNGKPLTASTSGRTITKSLTEYSNRLNLEINEIGLNDSGTYTCVIPRKSREIIYKNITIVVKNPTPPAINKTNLKKDIEMVFPNPLELFCEVSGIPLPTVTWFKNDEVLQPNRRIKMENRNQNVKFSSTEAVDEGSYRCEASNKVKRVSMQMSLRFTNKPNNMIIWISVGCASVFLFLFVIAVIIMCKKIRNERKLQRELEIAGLANFEKGAIENLNPELGIDDQAELLPYDKKWEFPIEKLKLGKQLGSGAFGVVMKGEAKGIIEGEESSTVAVKMVKKNADHTYIKALASELKIMVHLGKHLNVVNLLGACTKNVAKRELLVIVEFCKFGNLHNYLLRHRDNFINQVDPKTEHIDFNIGQDILERTYSVSSNRSNPQSPYLKYAALSFSNNSNQVPAEMADYRGQNYSGVTGVTDITLLSISPNSGDEGMVVSNNSLQPEWRSNYHGDYKGTVRPICTTDLLAWAFQVSRGMEYLASRKVLHGDLAARNILLAENNIVKICDFGLAKTMYKNDNYQKKGNGPLPVKWMAIESIQDRVFSTQSDVWSFGIVLWEFFSLARTPYPGMEADERLYNKLVEGYRMESPDFAPKEMYKMMLDCWKAKPMARPSFTRLAERIGSMLEDTVRKYYIDLNDPYLVMNTQRLEDGHNDYLAMLSPPNFEQLSSPHNYVNDLPQLPPTTDDSSGYLCMKPVSIFSPRPEDTNSAFDFNLKTKKNCVEGSKTEMTPMLHYNSNESDCENNSACNSPNSFANPSYILPPIVDKTEILKSNSDNYVNMPQNKNSLKEKNNNPFIKMDEDSKSIHYVNSNSRDWESVKV